MSYKSESLNWPEQLKTLENLDGAPRAQQKEALKVNDTHLTSLKAIKTCFDDKAIERVRLAAQGGPGSEPYILSFSNAQALCGLKQKVNSDNLPAAVHNALDMIIPQRLETRQIKALVEWMVKGNSAETFNPSEIGKKTKTDKRTADKSQTQTNTLSSELKKIMEVAVKADAEIARGDGQTAAQDELKALVEKMIEEAKKERDSGNKKEEKKKSKSASQNNPSWIWEWMLGVKFMSQLKSKAKKGELTANDKLLILVDKGLIKPLGWVFGNLGKLLKKLAVGLWHSVEEAAGKTAKKILAVVLPLLFIIAILWAVLAFFHFAVISPLHWLEAKVTSGFHWGEKPEEQPTPEPASQSVASSIPPQIQAVIHKKPEKKTEKPVTYQPSASFQAASSSADSSGVLATLYDPKLLELEIAALPKFGIVKAYPVTPDESIPGDMAVSRLQDLIDPDKYTMFIGGSQEKITFITPNNTNLIITYKSTDPFDIWGSSGPLNIFWEDVIYIHTDEIDVEDKTPYKIYQLSLVSSSSKYALTIQCATAADMTHLVSTLEYFIRHSRLGHDTALAGMPYLDKGIQFNNDGLITKLWAGSPADKAGLTCGEYLWSLGKNTEDPQNKKTLEAGLQSSTPQNLYITSAAEHTKLNSLQISGQPQPVPKRTLVQL